MAMDQVPTQLLDEQQQFNKINVRNQPLQSHYQPNTVFQPPGSYQYQRIPLTSHQEKNPFPIMFQQQRAQQIPLIYQYAQQHAPPQLNYYYQQQQPQEVIYHQQPIASMASSQQSSHEQQLQSAFVEQSASNAASNDVASINGNIINNSVQVPTQQFTEFQEEILPPQVDGGVNGNLIHIQPEAVNNVASDNQQAKLVEEFTSVEEKKQENHFQSPIVVGENQVDELSTNQSNTVIVQPNRSFDHISQSYQPPQKQINIQVFNSNRNDDQQSKETFAAPNITNGHTNNNNYQYLVNDDQDLLDSTPSTVSEAPSRQFLKKFKNFRTYEESTTVTSQSFSTSSSSSNNHNNHEKVLEITQRPPSNSFLAPVHAGVRLSNENLNDCVEDHTTKPVSFQNVQIIQDSSPKVPVYGEKIILNSQPATHVVEETVFIKTPAKTEVVEKPVFIEKQHHTEVFHHHHQHPVFIEKPIIQEVKVPVERTVFVKTPPKIIDRPVYISTPPQTKIVEKVVHHPVEVEKIVEKTVDRPYFIKSPPETKVVHHQVIVEKPVIKEVQVPVEKTVYIQSPPETKIVHQPVIQTVEKPVYIEKIVQQPIEVEKVVEKYIDRPIIQTIEKIVDRPVTVEKFIDRPYPVPYAVAVPYEKHVYHSQKPDFHVYTKSNKHNIFDFDGLFGFLGKKKEIKHIFVPSSQQHQLKQLGQHQLVQSTLTTIDPVKESPVFDFSRYATTHLSPVKPIYGVPSKPLDLASTGYSYPNPYAGKKCNKNSKKEFKSIFLNLGSHGYAGAGAVTIPSSWLNGNDELQQAHSSIQHSQVVSRYPDKYVGPTPLSDDYWAINGVSTKEGVKFRRNVENGRSLRIEYGGFHPKMSPSVEIDKDGKPLKKSEY